MQQISPIRIGIGFATGRKNFQKILRSYVFNWKESGLADSSRVSLHLFVAYDLTYAKTKSTDYTRIHSEITDCIDSIHFIGVDEIIHEIEQLTADGILTEQEAKMIFCKGYAAQRNAILYDAIKNKMDCLIFLDDDEYPVAVTNTRSTAIWGGQHVLSEHLKYIMQSDITHGYHCGYISPIPFINYNDLLSENDFRIFIKAISNDILNWDNVKKVMDNGGVTYADTNILTSHDAYEVHESNHTKFISGSNLCFNLTDPTRVFPFYNPPGARGEDTFYSTCLSERKVLKVPCYTFHDGFSAYNHLLEGVLPIKLKFITADNEEVVNRFYKACIGWIRYKPLLLYITQRDSYAAKIDAMRIELNLTLPKLCAYFKQNRFNQIKIEFEKYQRNVEKYDLEFAQTRQIWARLMNLQRR